MVNFVHYSVLYTVYSLSEKYLAPVPLTDILPLAPESGNQAGGEHCTALLYSTVLYCIVLYCTVLTCTALYSTSPNCTLLNCVLLSLYLDKRRRVQENTSMRSREFPRAQPDGTPETECWYFLYSPT